MNAPNKVYYTQTEHVANYFTTGKPFERDCIEYIRKDALMEIIEAARESAITQKNFNNCPVEQEARIDAYDYIKHKIESL